MAFFHEGRVSVRCIELRSAREANVARILAHRLDAVTRYLVDVKQQFAQAGGHLGMVDEVLETVMTRHPRGMRRPTP